MTLERVGFFGGVLAATLVGSVPAFAADANAGKQVFRAQCALCHSAEPNDNGGAQGPNLRGVLDRHAATAQGFSYTKPMRDSNLTWNAATLQRFLASPTTIVPGSSMVIALPKQDDRENIIAYFQALKDGTFKDTSPPPFGPPPGLPPAAAGPPKGEQDWKKDAPGRVHKLDVAALPAPFDTPAAANFPTLIDKPAAAKLSLPPGFKVDVFASGLQGPRAMSVAPNGDIFVSDGDVWGRPVVATVANDGSLLISDDGMNVVYRISYSKG